MGNLSLKFFSFFVYDKWVVNPYRNNDAYPIRLPLQVEDKNVEEWYPSVQFGKVDSKINIDFVQDPEQELLNML